MLMNRIIKLLEEEKYLADVDTGCDVQKMREKSVMGNPKANIFLKEGL